MTAAERRESRIYTPVSIAVIVAGWALMAAIEGGAL